MNTIKKKIHYIGYNTQYGNPNEYQVFPSCNGKMGYIIDSLLREEYCISLLSLGEGKSFKRSCKVDICDDIKVHYVGTFPNKGWIKVFAKLWLLLQIIFYVFKYVKRDEGVIVYHSTYLAYLFKIIVSIKKINLIYEVEEIYNAAWGNSDIAIEKELKSLQFPQKYIFVNDILPTYFDGNKSFVVCYGDYKIKDIYKEKCSNVINLVYAGVIGDEDSDVYLAIDAMYHLNEDFVLKIVGYGTSESIEKLLLYINKVNRDLEYNSIVYDGLLSGEEYETYLGKCQIGLSPRKLDDRLSNFTFPSKTLVYLTHRLNVVTSRISCIQKSKLNESVAFIDELTPKGLANSIVNVSAFDNKNLDILSQLDIDFCIELKKLVEL